MLGRPAGDRADTEHGWDISRSSSAIRVGSAQPRCSDSTAGSRESLAPSGRRRSPARCRRSGSTATPTQGRDLLQRHAAATRPRGCAARSPRAGDPRRADIGARPRGSSRHPHDHPPPSRSRLRRLSQLAPPRRGGADLRSSRRGLRRPCAGHRATRRAARHRRGAHPAHGVDRRGARGARPPRLALRARRVVHRRRGATADAVPELVAEVVASGARVYAVEPVRQTLEERFLALLNAEQARWQR